MHLLQQLRDGFEPQILPAALTLQNIVRLSQRTSFLHALYSGPPNPATTSELSLTF